MKKKKIILLIMCFLFGTSINAQQEVTSPKAPKNVHDVHCGAERYLQRKLLQDVNYQNRRNEIERYTQQKISEGEVNKSINGSIITIPVVVHVLYSNSTNNISDAQIQSQIVALNSDFRRSNPSSSNTWAQAADCEIEFCLAGIDPNGNATTGITRKSTTVSNWSDQDLMKNASSGGVSPWNTSEYLNIWIVAGLYANTPQGPSPFNGYSSFPGGNSAVDGVVMTSNKFGTIGTVSSPYNYGHITSHEIGHFLNLFHIWGNVPQGQNGCSYDDQVNDTPLCKEPTQGCPNGKTSCGSTDMIQNYMDYSSGTCLDVFTEGQKSRMRVNLLPGGVRVSLANSNKCGGVTAPTCSDGIQNGTETGIDCGGSSCAPCSVTPTCVSVNVFITFDAYSNETSWVIKNSSGQVIQSGGSYGNYSSGQTAVTNVCLPPGCYTYIIYDSYGDGICCYEGNGYYTVASASTIFATGSSFGYSQVTSFCIEGNTTDTQAPTPVSLSASGTTQTTTNLTWTGSTDNVAVTGYDVYKGSALIASVSGTTLNVNGLTSNTTYAFSVRAKDAAGNVSASSNVVNVTTSGVVLTYCGSAGQIVTDEYISKVVLETINNSSTAQSYSDFTNLSTNLTKGNSYTITVTPAWTGSVYAEGYSVWIDYNQDGDFTDAGEQVWTKAASTSSPVSGNFTIPSGAANGSTRMRVSMKYNGIPTSCETFQYGEVEDYTVNLVSSSAFSIFASISEEENELKGLSVFPNPINDGLLSVVYANYKANVKASIVVRDVLGRAIRTIEVTSKATRFNIDDLKSGIYSISIETEGGVITKRFTKQ